MPNNARMQRPCLCWGARTCVILVSLFCRSFPRVIWSRASGVHDYPREKHSPSKVYLKIFTNIPAILEMRDENSVPNVTLAGSSWLLPGPGRFWVALAGSGLPLAGFGGLSPDLVGSGRLRPASLGLGGSGVALVSCGPALAGCGWLWLAVAGFGRRWLGSGRL